MKGGIAGYVKTLVASTPLGDFQHVVTVGPDEMTEASQFKTPPNVKLVEIPITYSAREFWRFVRQIDELCEDWSVDFLHCHALRSGLVGAFLSVFFNRSFIYTNHGLRYTQKKGLVAISIFKVLEAFVVHRSKATICIRECDAQTLRRFLPRSESKIFTINTKLDIPESVHHDCPRFPPRLIGIGSLIGVKRVDRFIDWLEAVSLIGEPYEAVWLGDGPDRARLERYANEKGVVVSWPGQVNSYRVGLELEQAAMMLLSSEFEVLPLAGIEALARGVPIVASDFSGVGEFVVNGVTGIVVPKGADNALVASRISELLNDRFMIESFRIASRQLFSEKFSGSNTMASEYRKVYAQVMDERI